MRLLSLHTELSLGMDPKRFEAAMDEILGRGKLDNIPVSLQDMGAEAVIHIESPIRFTYRLKDLSRFFAWALALGKFTKSELAELEPLVVLELAGG